MTDKTNENAELATVDRYIADLNLRIDDLKKRMTTMASENYEVKNQSILLSTMQEVMKDLRQLRSEMLAVLGGNDNFSRALS